LTYPQFFALRWGAWFGGDLGCLNQIYLSKYLKNKEFHECVKIEHSDLRLDLTGLVVVFKALSTQLSTDFVGKSKFLLKSKHLR
jgi:hypothetical protein